MDDVSCHMHIPGGIKTGSIYKIGKEGRRKKKKKKKPTTTITIFRKHRLYIPDKTQNRVGGKIIST